MVAAKGRLNSLSNRETQGQRMTTRGQAKNFKIYSEFDSLNILNSRKDGAKMKPVLLNSGCYVNKNSDSKSGMKNAESKFQREKSVKVNVARKVLSDISNMEARLSAAERGQGSSIRKVKTGKMMHLRKDTVKLKSAEERSSDKLRTGKVGTNSNQATAEKQASRKSVNSVTKPTSIDPKTNFLARKSAIAPGRTSLRNPLPLARKSLPVLKQANQVETSRSTKQENLEKSENFRGKLGFPVRPSIQRSTIPKPFNFTRRHPGSRVSEGFAAVGSNTQIKVHAGLSTRNSVKGTMKTTKTALNAQRNFKSQSIMATHKMRSGQAVVSSKSKDKGSLSKDVISVASHEDSGSQEVISGRTNDINSKCAVARRNSDRRNSYTGSLISGSKDCCKPWESLPSIYDGRNHLEVTDYIEDIYQYYWFMEGQNPALKNYMEIQTDITPQMRGILINWLIEVHLKFDLMEETLYLTVTLLDRYLSLERIKKNEMQLVGLTALLLASKYEDFWHPRVVDLISISAESYTRDQVLIMEKTMLKKLKFRLNEPTPYVFMLRFLKAAQSDTKFEHLAFYLIELCLVECEALNYKPSILCASAIYVARCTMKMTPLWTPLLAKHARYNESQIRDCAEMILRFHKEAKTNLLNVTYEKYMTPDLSKVASLKPLDTLPVRYS